MAWGLLHLLRPLLHLLRALFHLLRALLVPAAEVTAVGLWASCVSRAC